MICSGVCRLLLIADLLAESPTSSDPNIRSGLLSGGHARGAAAIWLVLFATQYALQYRYNATDSFMQSYWSGFFIDLSFPEFFRTAGLGVRELWLSTVFGKDIEPLLPPKSTSVVIVISLIGLVSLLRKNPVAVAMLTGPCIAATAAAMLHRWPLIDRLLLFAAPSVIIFTLRGSRPTGAHDSTENPHCEHAWGFSDAFGVSHNGRDPKNAHTADVGECTGGDR
jgi:hypothetical protein